MSTLFLCKFGYFLNNLKKNDDEYLFENLFILIDNAGGAHHSEELQKSCKW